MRTACLLVTVLYVLLAAGNARAAYDIVVARDGTGDYTTVQAAILAVPDAHPGRTTIFIKAGTYKEKLTVPRTKRRVTFIGEDRDRTILTYDDQATSDLDDTVSGTASTPSISIEGKDFGARNITFSNTAGTGGPAIAVYVQGNRAHFRNCAFLGYQDTLCMFSKLAFFSHCYIEGAVDIIFGDATAIFKKCTIYCLAHGYVTAAYTGQGKPYGYVFKNCIVKSEAPVGSVYLGRPWSEHANVVFLNCAMDEGIAPEGWDIWEDSSPHDTAFFAEYHSTGEGADPDDRLKWSHQLTANDIGAYTLEKIFDLPPAAPADDAVSMLDARVPWYADYN